MPQTSRATAAAPRDAARRPAPARGTTGSGAGRPRTRPPAPSGARRSRHPRRTLLVVGGAVLLAALVVALVVWLQRGTTTPAGVDAGRVAELEAEMTAAEQTRDAANLGAAMDAAVAVQEDLRPTLEALFVVVPPVEDGVPVTSGQAAPPAADVAAWRTSVTDAQTALDAVGFGSSAHNVVRNGMTTAVGLLDDAIDAAELAGTTTDPTTAAELLVLAGSLRTAAVDTWALAATELDTQAVAADRGHLHVYLPRGPEDAGDGAAVHDHDEH